MCKKNISTETKKENIEVFFLGVTIFTSIASFGGMNAFSSICGKLMYVLWVLLVLFKLGQKKIEVNETIKKMLFIYVLFFILIKLLYYMDFYPSGGLGAIGYILYCMMFYIIGYNMKYVSYENLRTIFIFAFCAYIILLLLSFSTIQSLNGQKFWGKNQLGQMLGVAVIMETTIIPPMMKTNLSKIIVFSVGAISLYTLLQLQSRTPLIGLTVITIVTFILKENKKQKDYILAGAVAIGVIIIIIFLGGKDFLTGIFDLKGEELTSVEGINNLTSERLDWYSIAIKDIMKSPLVGVGSYAYIDNFVLCTLRCGGILLAVVLIPFVYGKLYKEFFFSNKQIQNKIFVGKAQVAIMKTVNKLSLFYFVISIMEGYPPLGPGTSVFLLWMMYGMFDNMMKGINET